MSDFYKNLIPIANLTDCDHEPIHIPGSIQPHGYLLAFEIAQNLSQSKALQISENFLVDANIENRKIRSIKMNDLFTQESIDLLESQVAELTPESKKTYFNATIHKNKDGVFIVELELPQTLVDRKLSIESKSSHGNFAKEGNDDLENAISKINILSRISEWKELHDTFAKEIKNITGYDRVMIYQFDDKWNGEVISESKEDHLLPFLGLHYPASDIPVQARELYKKNKIRTIPDIHYLPSPLIAVSEEPLDLSHSLLRSVSPLHVEYLGNMGVTGTMTISILLNDELWGMVACHHYSPKFVPTSIRSISALIANHYSNQLQHILDITEKKFIDSTYQTQEQLLESFFEHSNLGISLLQQSVNLSHLVPCDGVAILFDGDVYAIGETPNNNEIRELSKRIPKGGSAECFVTNEWKLPPNPILGQTEADTNPYPGVLMIELSKIHQNRIFWFRKEVVNTIIWSGEPHKAITKSGEDIQRLHPRKSFEAWKEEVKGTAKPWRKAETDAVTRFRSALLQALFIKNEKIQDLVDKISTKDKELGHIRGTLEEKEILLKEIHHRVKNNLQVVSSLLYLQQNQVKDPYMVYQFTESINRIKSISLVHELLYTSESMSRISLQTYFSKLVHNLEITYEVMTTSLEIIQEVEDVAIYLDQGIPCGLILNEMLTNSYKHAFPNQSQGQIRIQLKKIEDSNKTPHLELTYSDNGIGFEMTTDRRKIKSLGLTLIYSLSQQLAGQVQFQRLEPSGSEFKIMFPYKAVF